jgi:hypothetical protein
MNSFPVPKVDAVVRAVFDGLASGLNDTLWSNWLALPMVASMLWHIDANYWMADNDQGKAFYNFWLHPELQPYSGVDATPYCNPGEDFPNQKSRWCHFNRPPMGKKPSLYQLCKELPKLEK